MCVCVCLSVCVQADRKNGADWDAGSRTQERRGRPDDEDDEAERTEDEERGANEEENGVEVQGLEVQEEVQWWNLSSRLPLFRSCVRVCLAILFPCSCW